ncbi:MAG: HAD family phosphatase [Albidovulum sp.]|uniref:HAD family hydrolase n=1 Tax=Albidovulum sp. TaxID=1872424 RepID=UPI003CA89D4D
MRPAAVLFDCDGVIVDSEPITDRVIAANLGRHGMPVAPEDVNRLFIGGTMASVGDYARARGARLPDAWLDVIYGEIFACLAEGTPLVPGIVTVLDALDASGIPYAVGSNGPHAKMQVTLGQHPALHTRLKGRIFSREDVARPKPAPDLYLHAAQALGAAPEACIVVEDSATGVRAARAAGMRAFLYAPEGGGEAAEGVHVFQRMEALPGLFGI